MIKIKEPPPPWLQKKHLLVQRRVERTAFSDQNDFFKIEYISNFFHMNEIGLLLYQVLYKPGFLNMQLNHTTRLHRANFFSFSVKRETESIFCKTEKVIPMTCSSPRRTFFLHALSFECTSKLCVTYLNQFQFIFIFKKCTKQFSHWIV